jgi:hypothetical protein
VFTAQEQVAHDRTQTKRVSSSISAIILALYTRTSFLAPKLLFSARFPSEIIQSLCTSSANKQANNLVKRGVSPPD